MQVHGICIPEKDASWELETNAFGELLHRPECGAVTCHCIHGRKYSGKKYSAWDLVSCSDCGSTARHKYCENLRGTESSWLCNECEVFEDEIKKKKQSSVNYFPRVVCKLVDIKTNTSLSNFKNTEPLSETLVKTFQSDIVGEACQLDIMNKVCRPDIIDEIYHQDTSNGAYHLNTGTEAKQEDSEVGTFQSLDSVEETTLLVNGSNSLLSSHCAISYSKAGLNLDTCSHNVAGNSDSYVKDHNLNLMQLSETEDVANDSCNIKSLEGVSECLKSKAVSIDASESHLRNKTINQLHNESSQVTLKHFVSKKGKKRKLETKLPRKDACCMHPNKCIKRLLGYECHKYR
ncbi:G2/M phase-specific E3 ubiquitin-protein ligase, partial [Stegodyphus mimosarum]